MGAVIVRKKKFNISELAKQESPFEKSYFPRFLIPFENSFFHLKSGERTLSA